MSLLNIEVMQYGVRRRIAGNIMNNNKELKFRLLQFIGSTREQIQKSIPDQISRNQSVPRIRLLDLMSKFCQAIRLVHPSESFVKYFIITQPII